MQDAAELPEIRAFVALADTGSFAAASRLLQRDATVLSRRLQSLEARLGVRLAERTTRRVTVTEAGRAYLARVRPLLQDMDAASREAALFVSGEPHGRLKVALPGSFARRWFAPMVVGFLRAHGQVRLDAHYSDRVVDLIGEGYDLAVRIGEPRDSRVAARRIGEQRRLVCASPEYLARSSTPQIPEDVPAHACLCFAGREEFYRWDFRRPDGRTVSIAATCHLASDDPDLLVAAAVGGLGLLYTTDWHVGPDLQAGTLVEVLADWQVAPGEAIFVVTPTTGGVPSKTRAFSNWIAHGTDQRPWLHRGARTIDT